MKQKWNSEDVMIRDFLVQLQEYQIAQIPAKEVLQEKYRLSDLFYQKIAQLIKRQERKAKFREWKRGIVAAAAVILLMLASAPVS